MKYGVALRNAKLSAEETAIGASPKLRYYSGAEPVDCAAAATGTLLSEITAPVDWQTTPSGGQAQQNGVWSGVGAAGAGAGTNVGYARLYDNAGTVCHKQFTVTGVGGGGDIEMVNISIAVNQPVTFAYTLTDNND